MLGDSLPSHSNSVQGNKEPFNIPSISGRLPCVDDRSSTDDRRLPPSLSRAGGRIYTMSSRPGGIEATGDTAHRLRMSGWAFSGILSSPPERGEACRWNQASSVLWLTVGSFFVVLRSPSKWQSGVAYETPALRVDNCSSASIAAGDFSSRVSSSKGRPRLTTMFGVT